MSKTLQAVTAIGRSSSVKLASIGFLVLILLLPTAMIEQVIDERASLAQSARQDIMVAWGNEQSIIGPALVVPYSRTVFTSDERSSVITGHVYHLPQTAEINVNVDAQLRYRGLYTVPVYESQVDLQARFEKLPLEALGLSDAKLNYAQARLVIGLYDPRTLRATPQAVVAGTPIRFAAGARDTAQFGAHIVAPLQSIDLASTQGEFDFSTQFAMAGTDRIDIAPVGDTNIITMNANWPSPSFQGRYLPVERQITDAGFRAAWKVTSLGRQYPTSWLDDAVMQPTITASLFGAQLKTPLGTYEMAKRAIRYAVLAIGLSFACFFLFDIISALHLHPVQYLLIGFANCLFFLLLLTLSEHIAFLPAYLISAFACISLIGGYSAAVLHARRRAAVCVAVLIALYGFLFMTLRAQSFALLAGSLGLWAVLGAVMYLTRRVNWHVTTTSKDAV